MIIILSFDVLRLSCETRVARPAADCCPAPQADCSPPTMPEGGGGEQLFRTRKQTAVLINMVYMTLCLQT